MTGLHQPWLSWLMILTDWRCWHIQVLFWCINILFISTDVLVCYVGQVLFGPGGGGTLCTSLFMSWSCEGELWSGLMQTRRLVMPRYLRTTSEWTWLLNLKVTGHYLQDYMLYFIKTCHYVIDIWCMYLIYPYQNDCDDCSSHICCHTVPSLYNNKQLYLLNEYRM